MTDKEPKTIIRLRKICEDNGVTLHSSDSQSGWRFIFYAPLTLFWQSSKSNVLCSFGGAIYGIIGILREELKIGFFEDKERFLSESEWSEEMYEWYKADESFYWLQKQKLQFFYGKIGKKK